MLSFQRDTLSPVLSVYNWQFEESATWTRPFPDTEATGKMFLATATQCSHPVWGSWGVGTGKNTGRTSPRGRGGVPGLQTRKHTNRNNSGKTPNSKSHLLAHLSYERVFSAVNFTDKYRKKLSEWISSWIWMDPPWNDLILCLLFHRGLKPATDP